MPDMVHGLIPNTTGAINRKRKNVVREQNIVICDTVRALALCHNVTPTFPNEFDKKEVEYQASSPDEIALVKFAASMGMNLNERDQHFI
jgi:phospholipid-translocating ATPase